MSKAFMVRLNHELFGGSLQIRRVPQYLRFTVAGLRSPWPVWRALDQVGDMPDKDENVIAGRLAKQGIVHASRTIDGRHAGGWWPSAIYDVVESQPSQEMMSDWEQWQAWCYEQEEEKTKKGGA
jgi:hypothetical protein